MNDMYTAVRNMQIQTEVGVYTVAGIILPSDEKSKIDIMDLKISGNKMRQEIESVKHKILLFPFIGMPAISNMQNGMSSVNDVLEEVADTFDEIIKELQYLSTGVTLLENAVQVLETTDKAYATAVFDDDETVHYRWGAADKIFMQIEKTQYDELVRQLACPSS